MSRKITLFWFASLAAGAALCGCRSVQYAITERPPIQRGNGRIVSVEIKSSERLSALEMQYILFRYSEGKNENPARPARELASREKPYNGHLKPCQSRRITREPILCDRVSAALGNASPRGDEYRQYAYQIQTGTSQQLIPRFGYVYQNGKSIPRFDYQTITVPVYANFSYDAKIGDLLCRVENCAPFSIPARFHSASWEALSPADKSTFEAQPRFRLDE
jgi:hypothetical protein